jgi:hypothetical protein
VGAAYEDATAVAIIATTEICILIFGWLGWNDMKNEYKEIANENVKLLKAMLDRWVGSVKLWEKRSREHRSLYTK